MQTEIIYNPYSGPIYVHEELEAVAELLRGNGWTVDIREVHEPLEGTRLAREAVDRGAQVVVAAGGDGMVSEVASGLVGTEVVLGVIPVGTTNVWALQMHIPTVNPILNSIGIFKLASYIKRKLSRPLPADHYRSVILNAGRVLLEGKIVTIDVGQMNERYFLMWMGVGWDAGVMQQITSKSKRRSGFFAYVKPALGAVRRYSGKDMVMILDGEEVKVKSPLVVVTNIRLYGGVFNMGVQACVDDGKLDVCVFKGKGFFTFLRHILKLAFRRHTHDRQVAYYQCREIAIRSESELPVHVDGDTVAHTPVFVRTVPSALKVIVPQKAPRNLFVSR